MKYMTNLLWAMSVPAMLLCVPIIVTVALLGLALVCVWWAVETFVRWFLREFTMAMEKSPGD